MVYQRDDPAVLNMLDRAMTRDHDSGVVGAVCGLCGESIYRDEEYYSDGDLDMCCSCYNEFVKIW